VLPTEIFFNIIIFGKNHQVSLDFKPERVGIFHL